MPKSEKPSQSNEAPENDDTSQYDRAPRQKNEHRDPVNSAETTKDIPTKNGALK